jgi:hypothetical protein
LRTNLVHTSSWCVLVVFVCFRSHTERIVHRRWQASVGNVFFAWYPCNCCLWFEMMKTWFEIYFCCWSNLQIYLDRIATELSSPLGTCLLLYLSCIPSPVSLQIRHTSCHSTASPLRVLSNQSDTWCFEFSMPRIQCTLLLLYRLA